MKFVRLGALFGSIVLLVATSITMINKRSELRSDQDARVDAALTLATQAAFATIDTGDRRRRRRLDGADRHRSADVDGAATRAMLDALTASLTGSSACSITATVEECTAGSMLLTDAYEHALDAANQLGHAAAVVDESTDAIVVVGSGTTTVSLQVPATQLVNEAALESIEKLDAETSISVIGGDAAGVVGPDAVDGTRVVGHVGPAASQRWFHRRPVECGRRRRTARSEPAAVRRAARPRHGADRARRLDLPRRAQVVGASRDDRRTHRTGQPAGVRAAHRGGHPRQRPVQHGPLRHAGRPQRVQADQRHARAPVR